MFTCFCPAPLKTEKQSFLEFAPAYFTYMGRRLLSDEKPTCLAKVLGVYSVSFKPSPAGLSPGSALLKELKDKEFSEVRR